MKKITFIVILTTIAFYSQGFKGGSEDVNLQSEISVQKEQKKQITFHPKKKIFRGKVVTREDYVPTSNPKRLVWNKIRERNNPVPSSGGVNQFHKRRALINAAKKKRTNVGSPSGPFVKRKRKHS